MTIEEFLNNAESNYQDGIKLLKKHGAKPALVTILSIRETQHNWDRLRDELHRIYKDEAVAKPEKNRTKSQVTYTTDEVKYPEPLRPAVRKLASLYAIVNHWHPQLDMLWNKDRKKCFEAKMAIQQSWDEIERIWRLVNYYNDHGVILPNKYSPEERYRPRDRAELVKRRNNLRTYISKHKKSAGKLVQVKEWEKELSEIEIEIEHGT